MFTIFVRLSSPIMKFVKYFNDEPINTPELRQSFSFFYVIPFSHSKSISQKSSENLP